MSGPKTKRLNVINDTDGCSRSLNDFHDSILKHILSFLPTKMVVRTSVLSKRWQFMWASIPNLEFRENEYRVRKDFINFVERALILHDVPKIHKFSLACRVANDISRIKMWITGAVRRNSQKFDIAFHDERAPGNGGEDTKHVFPFCLFKCETMEVLKLDMTFAVRLPSQIYLPRLKILSLSYLTFEDYHPTNLLFASPALEQLFLRECTWGHESELVISGPKLWKLCIHEYNKGFTLELASSSVTITAPQLKIFRFVGGWIKDYRFPNASSIIKAVILCRIDMEGETNVDHFEKLLRSVQLVKHLQLSHLYIEVLSKEMVPIFKNLIILEIMDGQVDLSCEELEIILNKCPCLKTLKFSEGFSIDARTYKSDRLLNLKFVYLPSTLKNIMIGGFRGKIKEILAVQILLSQLTSLENLEISFLRNDEAEMKEIKAVLSALPRASKSCKLNIR